MFRTIVRSAVAGSVLVGVCVFPGVALAQTYVPAPTPGDPIVVENVPLQPVQLEVPTPAVAPAPTAAPATSVAPAAVVEGVAISDPGTPVVEVKGVQLSANSTPAFTGSNATKPLVATSGVLLVVGGALVAGERRRRKLASN